jgi:DNA helicase-2/ATP-dependent DNA helicase PcrA
VAEDGATVEPGLDESQAEVVEAPVSARLIVTAGPGTGKTRTLLARADRLIDEEDLEPAFDLMVLSFSRAAVETVARRGFEETRSGRLPVATIDSTASRILFESGVRIEPGGFDSRIRQAIAAIEADPPGLADFLSARHVLVDEAQDVVGIRARFVRCLLAYACRDEGAGFTVFGDAAQAIFDFQLSGEEGAERLLDLGDDPALGVEQRELTTNHRMQNPRLVQIASDFGPPLRVVDQEGPWAEIRRRLVEEIELESGWSAPKGAVAEVRAVVDPPWRPEVAVLTRRNSEALRLASRLQGGGLDVAVRHRAQDRGGAPWLVPLFGGEEFADVPVPQVDGLPHLRPWFQPPPELPRALRDARVAKAGRVDLRRLAALLRSGACPEELVVRREAEVTVSTIHQAKGLEFDTVFVVEPESGAKTEDSPEEARVLYVAATRARDELLHGAALESQGLVGRVDGEARVLVRPWAGRWSGRNPPAWIEVKVSDSDPEWAPDDRDGFERLQRFLLERAVPGERAELRLREGRNGSVPIYDIIQNDGGGDGELTVGRTSPAFGRMLATQTRDRTPDQIAGMVSDIPDAAVLGPATARRLGLGEHGIHLRARVYGLAWVST